ncbi:MAG: hypothetical protein VKK32_02975 [Candidatus Melainabacteria bacterium]|nr:hypothetical protein [Candidatus Melainabacteria bacterium]
MIDKILLSFFNNNYMGQLKLLALQEFKVISMKVYPGGILTALNNRIREAGGQPLFEVGPANSMNKELTTASPETQRYLAREMAHSNFSNTHPRVLSMVHRLWTHMRHNIDEKGIEAQENFMSKAEEQLLRAESFKDGYLEIKDRFSKTMLNEDNLRFYFFEPAEEILKDFVIKQLENAFQKSHLENSFNENHEKKGDSSLKKDFETFIKSDTFQARLEERVSQVYNGLLEQSQELNEALNERVAAESRQHGKDKNHQSIEDVMKQSLADMFYLIVIPLLDHQVE